MHGQPHASHRRPPDRVIPGPSAPPPGHLSPHPAADEALAHGVQQGHREDLAVLVERHYSPLVGYLYRLTNGDRPLGEDIAQETFLRALRGIGGYDPARPFKPWLYAIATNLLRGHLAAADTRRTLAVDDPDDDTDLPADDSPLLEQQMLADDMQQAAIAALRMLPSAQREVIVLRYLEDWALSDIAAALAIPVGTVKSRLSVGLRRLRAILEAQEQQQEHPRERDKKEVRDERT